MGFACGHTFPLSWSLRYKFTEYNSCEDIRLSLTTLIDILVYRSKYLEYIEFIYEVFFIFAMDK